MITICVLLYMIGLFMAVFAPTERGGLVIIVGSLLMLASSMSALYMIGGKF